MVMIWRTIRHLFGFWQPIAAAFLLTMAAPVHATLQEIRVLGVGIESSSMKANELAIDYARKRAVYLAIKKLGVPNPGKVGAKLSNEQLRQIIRGANVVQTRRKGVMTFHDVNVTIVDEALRRAVKLSEKPEGDEPQMKMRGILLLSVYAGSERAYMWEKDNQLRQPLSDEIRRQARGGVLLPGGDLEDLRLVDYQNALTVKPEELKPMFARYGAEEIIVAVLKPSAPGTMDASTILLRRLKPDGEHNEVLEIAPAMVEETSAVRLAKAANAIASAITQIATSTAERDAAARAAAKKLTLRFSYAIPKELARMEAAVRDSPATLYLEVPSIALARVGATVYLKGEAEALRAQLVKQGIIVTAINDGWRLSVR
jgi:Uncharacterized protein conserved in bacteria (DUF2066)